MLNKITNYPTKNLVVQPIKKKQIYLSFIYYVKHDCTVYNLVIPFETFNSFNLNLEIRLTRLLYDSQIFNTFYNKQTKSIEEF